MKSLAAASLQQQQKHEACNYHKQNAVKSAASTSDTSFSIAEKLGLGSEVHELKLGSTFYNNEKPATAFHTIKCKNIY